MAQEDSAKNEGRPVNALGFTVQDYQGGKSTLCEGCGHNAITAQIVQAAWESGVEPHRVAKISGIGCSSKTTAYFMGKSWGFNTLHGRAPAVATGAALANRGLLDILVSGDGDSLSIGTAHLVHMIRRNVPVVYIIDDNGVYALTKGQFSATSDLGSALKHGQINGIPPIDPCALAIELGCGFVARTYSGNTKQLKTILRAAMAYGGMALIDALSPCVTFNNHETSTKSYRAVTDRNQAVHDLDFVMPHDHKTVEIPPGEVRDVTFPDGSVLSLRAIHEDYDPGDRARAMAAIHESQAAGTILTGLLFHAPKAATVHDLVGIVDAPLVSLGPERTKPGRTVLEEINAELR
jgi:2-oxoglutarate ferredoxin oxidoreductase subunit beta